MKVVCELYIVGLHGSLAFDINYVSVARIEQDKVLTKYTVRTSSDCGTLYMAALVFNFVIL